MDSERRVTIPIGRLFRFVSGGAISATQITSTGQYPVYGGNGIRGYTDSWNATGFNLLVGRQGALAGNIHRTHGPIYATEHALVASSDSAVDGDFAYWLLTDADLNQYAQNVAAQPGLAAGKIRKVLISLPVDIVTQRFLARYLDQKSSQIDALVGKLTRQVELLERYRREVSWEALTGGLEKASHKVDSEVDWIGLMPESWTTIPGRHLFEVVKRIEPGFSDRVLSITQKGIVPKDLSSHFGQLAESYDLYQRVDAGDYAMNSMDLLTGWVDRSAYDGVTSPDYRVFRLRQAIAAEPRYFTHVLQMGYTRRIFYRYGQGVSNLGRWRLQPKVFLNMRFPLPPLDQQRRIADYIEEKYAEIDSTIADINKQIELLVKYRKQVINDAVTGKVRVGEVA